MRPARLRLNNQRQILEYLHQHQYGSRAAIADACGISRPTVGKIIDELQGAGVLRSHASAVDVQSPGRPSQLLAFDDQLPRFVGIELGVQRTCFKTLSVDGTLHSSSDYDSVTNAAAFVAQVERWQLEHGLDGWWAAAISMPGVVDEQASQVLKSPNMPWTESATWFEQAQAVLGCPLSMLQEVRARALSHLQQVQQQSDNSFLYVWNGAGLGAALVLNGALFVGPSTVSAELGHTPIAGEQRPCGCGNNGCLETLIAEPGLCLSAGVDTWQDCCAALAAEPQRFYPAFAHLATHIAAAVNVSGVRRIILSGNFKDLPGELQQRLQKEIGDACLWSQFGTMQIRFTDNTPQQGLVACLHDRFLMNTTDWTLPCHATSM